MSEADVHSDFYFHIRQAIEDQSEYGSVEFSDVRNEYGEGMDGFADIVLFDGDDDPFLVIEVKPPDQDDKDPYKRNVVQQAFRYAGQLGAPYFATYNGERLVLFDSFESGRTLLERSTKSYQGITNVGDFTPYFLEQLGEIEAGDINWDALDKAFVERIRGIHESITPPLTDELTKKLDADDEFRNRFSNWVQDSFGVDETEALEPDVKEEFTAQATYILLNKIIFHKILENTETYEEDIRPLAVSIYRVQEDLEEFFSEIVANVDFEAVFEHDDIFDEVPLDPVAEDARDFIMELDDQDLSQFDSDIVGQIYQKVIPEKRRHSYGEYYTPPPVCEFITELTINDPSNYVLDPGCGSGGFLISAYNDIKGMLPEPNGSHQRVLNQLYGIDINRFPAHLSAINLAIRDLSEYTDDVNIEVNNFFRVQPDMIRYGRETATAEGSQDETGLVDDIGGFDAIVANPPYIRSSNIANQELVRDHLSREEIDAEYLSRRCDIYAYFITHATEFLDDDGRLGFIVSDGWLHTQYGQGIQRFVLDNYAIEAIVKFDRQVFEDSLVESNILILQRETDKSVRDSNVAKFIRFTEGMPMDEMVSVVREDYEADEMIVTDKYRIVTREQNILYNEDKWTVFFLAPPAYFEAVDTPACTPLSELADQHRANTSGANDFFHLRETENLSIDEYLTPLAKASGQIDRILFSSEDAEEWSILDVDNIVSEAMEEADIESGETESQVKRWLSDNGHEELLAYIQAGERQGANTGRTCESRDVWFDLGELDRTRILFPRFTWEVFRAIWNEADAAANNQFYHVATEHDDKVLCGILNSRLVWMFYELRGRVEGGEGMNRTEITGYELEDLPVPDIRQMAEDEKDTIRDAFDDLIEREREIGPEVSIAQEEDERDALDSAVLNAIGMGDRVDEIKDALEGVVQLREEGGGENTRVLVERVTGTTDEPEVIELPGVSDVQESTTLDEYS